MGRATGRRTGRKRRGMSWPLVCETIKKAQHPFSKEKGDGERVGDSGRRWGIERKRMQLYLGLSRYSRAGQAGNMVGEDG